MPNQMQLIEIGTRAREFLALEIADHQRGLVATMAESFTDALFPPEDGWDGSETWIRGVTRNGVAAGFIMCSDPPDSKVEL